MAKTPDLHSYSDRAAFDRLMLLIATFIHYPGVGTTDEDSKQDNNSLHLVQNQMQQLATQLNLPFPTYSIHTLRKDLATLRQFKILEQRQYRSGYYLGTGVFSLKELALALQALMSQSIHQGDARARQVHRTLLRRLRMLDVDLGGTLFYPVRQHLNRAIVYTDPEEMMEDYKHQETLFHQLPIVEDAICKGQAIEIARGDNPYNNRHIGMLQVYPLQLIYYDVAWYLACEHYDGQHFAIGRIDRFKDHCKILKLPERSIQTQMQQLQKVHKLLNDGWGLFLGKPEDQQLELQKQLPLNRIKVRFFPPVIPFILEGERRHPTQSIHKGPIDPTTGNLMYVDYSIKLPDRSIDEFSRWIYRFMHHAQVLAPATLVEQHRAAADRLQQRYQTSKPS